MTITRDEALDHIASRLLKIKEETGPESIAFFAGYPKIMRPFLKRMAHSFGSPNYCTESSVCFQAANMAGMLTYGYKFGIGSGAEIKSTKCILNWSTNPPHSSAPTSGNIIGAVEAGAKLIDVGPLKTPLSEIADVHLRLRPGTCGALALGMAHVIIEEGLYDKDFVDNWVLGFEQYRSYVKEFTPDTTEQITGVQREKIIKAARLYATTKPAALVTSSNTTVHHTNGVQNHRAVTALIGLTGNYDRRGGNHIIPASYYEKTTGLAHREHEFEQTRQWKDMAMRIGEEKYPIWSKLVPQAQATELPFQIGSGKPYPVRGLLGFGLNHRMWADSNFMKESLKKLDFFVEVDFFMTDSAKLADIVLPSCTSFERSELLISPARFAFWTDPVIEPIGESRPDVDIIIDLAERLNLQDDLMAQGHEACMDWIFAPSKIKIAEIKKHPGGSFLTDQTETAYEKYKKAGFPTPSGKMELTSTILEDFGINPLPVYKEPLFSPVSTPELFEKYSLVLTTGARLPMYVHSRTFRVPWLRRLHPDPTVDINPKNAESRGIEQNQWVTLETPHGKVSVRANITKYVPPGVVNMIHGFPGADINETIPADYRDPISGYPGFKSILCEVQRAESCT